MDVSQIEPAPATQEAIAPTSIDAVDLCRQALDGRRPMRILILSSDTGGGHRASAAALESALESLYGDAVDISIVDFWVHLAKGPFVKFPQQYTYLAKHPWMWKFTFEATRFPPGRAITESFFNAFASRNVRQGFQSRQPDLIVSVHPLVNTLSLDVLRTMSARSGLPTIPYVTVVTDLGGAHPTWFNKRSDMTYIPVPAVLETARRARVPDDRLREFGLPVRPDFWESCGDKTELRYRLGMHPDHRAILAVGGGDGVGGLRSIATELATGLFERFGYTDVQVVVICGKNDKLRESLSRQSWPVRVIALGFVTNMSDWMGACDVLCTKAGPGTIAEGLIRGLPIVVTGFLPGQEEANMKLVVEEGVGEFAKKPEEITRVVSRWLSDPELLDSMSRHAKRLGRPTAATDIARDIMQVARGRLEENVGRMEMMQRIREARKRGGLSGLYQFVPHGRMLEEGSSQSHVWFRLKILLKVVLGSLVVREAWHRQSGSRSPTPPGSTVGDGGAGERERLEGA